MNTNVSLQDFNHRITHASDLRPAAKAHPGADDANRELLPAPDYVSVSGTIELLKMMLEISQTDRKTMKETQRSTEKAATAAENAEVKELRAQADSTFSAALVDGFVKLGTAAATMAASEMEIHSGALKSAANGAKTAAKTAQLTAQSAKLAATAARLKGAVNIGGAVMGPVTGLVARGASLHGVAAKQEEHRTAALRRSSDNLKSDIDNIRQHDSKLFDLVREIESAMNRCTQIALQTR